MKRKITLIALTLVCAACFVFGLAACDNEPSDGGKTVHGLQISESHENITYGETPALDYKLTLYLGDNEYEEIAKTDAKLSVKYYHTRSYMVNEDWVHNKKEINSMPDKWLCGEYEIKYVYDGKVNDPLFCQSYNVTVLPAQGNSDKFTIEAEKNVWYADEAMPALTLKNASGQAVNGNVVSEAQFTDDDKNGIFNFYYCTKAEYDAFTAEQKEYFPLKNAMSLYSADYPLKVGKYVALALIDNTYNYESVITHTVELTVNDPIVERTFNFQSIVVKDGDGNIVTDDNNEMVNMAAVLTQSNKGNTVICKANGEIRGTVDFGVDAFDKLSPEEVYTYTKTGIDTITIYANTEDGQTSFSGVKSGDTFTMEINMSSDTEILYWVITFTCS